MSDPLDIAGSALTSERLRMDIISNNIANMNSTHNAQGELEPYKRKMVVFKTIMDEEIENETQGVTVESIMEDTAPMRHVYDPGHPDANSDGYVTYPNVSIEREMVDMISAKAAYEANVTSIQTYKSIFNASLEI